MRSAELTVISVTTNGYGIGKPVRGMRIGILSSFIGELGYDSVIEGCYDLGVYDIELRGKGWGTAHEKPSIFTPEGRRERESFLEQLKSNRIHVSCINIQTFYFDREGKPMIPNLIELARDIFKSPYLETRNLYLGPPNQTDPSISDEEYAIRVSDGIRIILDKTADLSLEIALENHGSSERPLGVKKEFLQLLLKYVNSEKFGLTLDTGCFYWLYPLEEYYRVTECFLPYVKHVHLKNQSFQQEQRHAMKKGSPSSDAHDTLYEGDIDLRRVISMLKGVGYDGTLVIEDHSFMRLAELEGGGILERRKIIRKDIEHIRDML